MKHHRKARIIACAAVLAALAVSIGLNVFLLCNTEDGMLRYLQSPEQIYLMEAGILSNNLKFAAGEDYGFSYDFDREEYAVLIERYAIDRTAGAGTEFEKALRLMNEYAPRLRHDSSYDNHVKMDALSLLEYSLDNREQGINCRAKAQILNEMCLSLGIYARKVWLLPYSGYDSECHVVNEVWDSARGKWVMLDITSNEYWVDADDTPLSLLEIRRCGATREFCTPVKPGDALDDLASLKERYLSDFLYLMKNLVCLQYCGSYSVGESDTIYVLLPEKMDSEHKRLISETACSRAPFPQN